jgi:endo-1,4-beta-D-glucanase Y
VSSPGGTTGDAASGGTQAASGGGNATGGLRNTGGGVQGGTQSTPGGSASATGGVTATGGSVTIGSATGGASSSGGRSATGGASGGAPASGGSSASGGVTASGGTSARGGNATGGASAGGSTAGAYPFPQNVRSSHCTVPRNAKANDVVAAYQQWKTAVVTTDGAGGYLRIKKPDSGTVIGSTVSEGIGYGMLLAVYMGDQSLLDNLWLYEQSHLDSSGLMNWEIGPDNQITSGGNGAATDGDEDMAFALIMADRQWGKSSTLKDGYLNYAKTLIAAIWQYEVDHSRGEMLKPGDQWGDKDVTNPSYFAPAYYRVFGEVTGKAQDWNKVVDSSYTIIAKSLNATSGNQDNGLVPAWCNSGGTPVEAYSGAPMYFQNDSTRTPFRIGQDYCYFGESRAFSYLAKISAFYAKVGVANITNGYNLDGTAHPEKSYPGLQAASFVGPAGVGAMSDPQYQQFIDDAYAEVATLQLTAGTIYYQKSWTALSLLMMTGNFFVFGSK